MDSSNITNSSEAMRVRHILEGHSLIFEISLIARYTVAVLAVLINGFIALAFLVQKCRRSTVQLSPAGLLVMNLLIADAFLGAISIVNMATQSMHLTAWPYWCSIRLGISYLAMIGSHVALINVAIDRYIAIIHTLLYRDWMTMKRSITMLCAGWMVPLTGAVIAIASNDWTPGLVRCSEIPSFKIFLIYAWVPSHVLAILLVIIIQCRVYFELRRHEKETAATNQILRRFSHKSAKILFRVTTTYVLCWGPFDVALVVIVIWINPLIKTMYDLTLVFAQLSFLVNPLIYSYQTANIRRPVSDLFGDINKWLRPHSCATTDKRPVDVAVIRTIGPFQKMGSSSSVLTQCTSAEVHSNVQ